MTQGTVAVVVLSHTDPPQIDRLVGRLLEGRRTVVVLHHDPRGPELTVPASDRVVRVADAQPCDWGRMSLAEGVFRGLDTAYRAFDDLEWALVISGADYPCRSMPDIEAVLETYPHDAMLRWFQADGDPADDMHHWQAATRRRYLRRRRLPGSRRAVPWPRRHPFAGPPTLPSGTSGTPETHLYVGDMWPNLGRAAVEHVLAQRERRRDLWHYFEWASVPDEGLLPTLLLNDGDLDVANDRRRFIRWVPGNPHPETLTLADLSGVRESDAFFARKVSSSTSASLLDELDRIALAETANRARP